MVEFRVGHFHLMPTPPWTTENQVIREEIDHIVEAEDLGFDAAWLGEHSGVVRNAFSNSAPSRAMRSMCGVRTHGCP